MHMRQERQHRLTLRPEAQMRGETVADMVERLLTNIRVPGTTSRIAT